MAQGDIVDLDLLLDEYEAGQLAESAAAQAQQKSAEATDLEQLMKFGYDPQPPSSSPSQFSLVSDRQADQRARKAASDRGILADDPYFVENYLGTADPQIKAEYTGVDFTGGAEGDVIRQMSFLPPDVGSDPHYVQRVVQQNYAESFDIPRTYDYNVRVEPNTGDLIFNDPLNNNQPTVINPPGIQMGDFSAFAEPIAAEITAGIVGGVVGGVATAGNPIGIGGGALVGETLATYVWRLNNLTYLDEKGYLPEDYDINARAMKDASMTALFSLGGVGVFKLAKMAFRVGSPGKVFPLNEDEFVASYNKVAQETGEDVTAMTSPQVMIRAMDEGVEIKSPVAETEQVLRAEAEKMTDIGADLRQKYGVQERQATELVEAPFGAQDITRQLVDEEAGAAARAVRGVEFSDAAREALETNPRMVEAERAITDLNLQSDTIFRELGDGVTDPATAGQAIRTTFQQAKDVAIKAVDDAYEEAAQTAGFRGNSKPYDYSALVKPVRKAQKIVDNQAFPDARDAKRLKTILDSINSGSMKSHSVFVKDLSELRSIIRQQRDLGKNVDDLVSIRDGMLAIRKKALKDRGSPEALAKYEGAETIYRELNEDFNNKAVKNMLKIQNISADKYAQGDKQAYDGFVTFLRSNITKNADGTLNSPEFINRVLLDPENVGGLNGLKAGLRNEFMNKVVAEQGGVLKPKSATAYKNFMDKNGSVIKKFFNEDEIAQFNSAESFIKTFRQNEIALAKTRDLLAKSTNLPGIADNLNQPETVFKDTWKAGEITATRELFDAVTTTGNKELIDAYKSYIYKDLMAKTQVKGSLGKKTFNGAQIESYLDEYGDAMDVWFGKKFRKQLTDIAEKIKPYDNLGVYQLSEADQFMLKSLNNLARAYVGIFTTPGRVLTAVKTIYGGNAARRQLKLLADPDKLYNIIMRDKWQKNPVLKGLVRELGRVFYREEINQPEPQTDVTSEETTQFGPGYQENQQNFKLGGHVVQNLGVPLRYGYGE
tara:strand:+ start:366 stop:3362 length:2997 start_codon:yes stop_codon:yes gene_type:complete